MPPIPRLTLCLATLCLAAGCGPRADAPAGGADLGPHPEIYTGPGQSYFPTPEWTLDAAYVVFPVSYILKARDTDANMRSVRIQVDYVDCNGNEQPWETTEDLPPTTWRLPEISVTGETTDRVQVPTDCYPSDDVFVVSLRVRDARGNLSNLLRDEIQVGASQGPGSG